MTTAQTLRWSQWALSILCILLSIVQPTTSLKVIGPGLGRSGTDSLKIALNELGLGPTYHMKELLFQDSGISTWGDPAVFEAAGNGEQVDWRALFDGWASAVDLPASLYWEELYQHFPDARVVLTVRPPDQWFASIRDSICQVDGVPSWFSAINQNVPFSMWKNQKTMLDAGYWKFVGTGAEDSWARVCSDEEYATQRLLAWHERVKQVVPPDRLLIFETGKHGYKELAEFLGVEDPGKEYPRINSKAEFANIVMVNKILAAGTVLAPVVLLVVLYQCCLKPTPARPVKKVLRKKRLPKAD